MKTRIATLLLSLLCWASTALAQDAAPEQLPADDPVARAVALDQKARTLFEAGDFEAAARTFDEAFATYPEKSLLKSAGVAWFKAGKCPESETRLQKYVKTPDLPKTEVIDSNHLLAECALGRADAAFASGDLDAADAEIAAVYELTSEAEQSKRATLLKHNVDTKRKERAAAQAAADAEKTAASQKPAPGTSEPAPRATPWTTYVGWTMVGAAAVGVGVFYGLHAGARSKFDELEAACAGDCSVDQGEERAQQFLRVRRFVRAEPGVLAVAYTTALSGLMLWWLGSRDSEAPAVSVAPAVSPTGAGLAFSGSF